MSTQIQTAVRGQGQAIYPDHQSEVVFYCKDYIGQLICLLCATSTHQGHTLDQISDIASKQMKKIQDFVRKAETKDLPQIRNKMESVDQRSKDNTENFKKLTNKIQSQG